MHIRRRNPGQIAIFHLLAMLTVSLVKLVCIRLLTFSGRIYHTPCAGQDIEGGFSYCLYRGRRVG